MLEIKSQHLTWGGPYTETQHMYMLGIQIWNSKLDFNILVST